MAFRAFIGSGRRSADFDPSSSSTATLQTLSALPSRTVQQVKKMAWPQLWFSLLLLFPFPASANALRRHISPTLGLLPPGQQQKRHSPVSVRLPLNIVVGLPAEDDNPLRNPYKLSIAKAQPVFDVAIDDIIGKFKVSKGSKCPFHTQMPLARFCQEIR